MLHCNYVTIYHHNKEDITWPLGYVVLSIFYHIAYTYLFQLQMCLCVVNYVVTNELSVHFCLIKMLLIFACPSKAIVGLPVLQESDCIYGFCGRWIFGTHSIKRLALFCWFLEDTHYDSFPETKVHQICATWIIHVCSCTHFHNRNKTWRYNECK